MGSLIIFSEQQHGVGDHVHAGVPHYRGKHAAPGVPG